MSMSWWQTKRESKGNSVFVVFFGDPLGRLIGNQRIRNFCGDGGRERSESEEGNCNKPTAAPPPPRAERREAGVTPGGQPKHLPTLRTQNSPEREVYLGA